MSIHQGKEAGIDSQSSLVGESESIKRDIETLAKTVGLYDLLVNIPPEQLITLMNQLPVQGFRGPHCLPEAMEFNNTWLRFIGSLQSGQLVDFFDSTGVLWHKCVFYGAWNNIWFIYATDARAEMPLPSDQNPVDKGRGSPQSVPSYPKILPHGIVRNTVPYYAQIKSKYPTSVGLGSFNWLGLKEGYAKVPNLAESSFGRSVRFSSSGKGSNSWRQMIQSPKSVPFSYSVSSAQSSSSSAVDVRRSVPPRYVQH